MYVSDRERRIEYLGNGWINLPPSASCVEILDGFEQEGSRLLPFSHWRILLNDESGTFFDVPEDGFFFDEPEQLSWGSEFREITTEHWHWFDIEGHRAGEIHCSLKT